MPEVLNMYHDNRSRNVPPVYIGRPSKWGNPFMIGRDGTREEVVAKYKDWLDDHPELIEQAKAELKGRDLLCFCAPQWCHGYILERVANG